MPKPVIAPTDIDITVQKNFTAIREVLCGGASLDNFNLRVIEGITSSTPDQEKFFIHSMSPQPCGWFPLAGDIYVQAIDSKYIDVRSTKGSVAFKIIVLQGPQITAEVAVNPPEYQDTEDIINVIVGNDSGGTGATTQSTFEIKTFTCNGINANGTGTSTYRSKIYNDSSYFYVAPSGMARVWRINKTTGIASSVTTSAALTCMTSDGRNLYAASIDVAGNCNLYTIDIATFTLSSTVAFAIGFVSNNLNCIYVDSSYFYLCVTNTNGVSGSIYLNRYPIGGGAATQILLLAGTGTAATIRASDHILSDGTSLWLNLRDTVAVNNTTMLARVNLSTFALTATYSLPADVRATGYRTDMVLVDNAIYLPIVPQATGGATLTAGMYYTAVVKFDIPTTKATKTPLPGFIGVNSPVSIIHYNGDLYVHGSPTGMINEVSSSTIIARINIADGTTTVYSIPVQTGAGEPGATLIGNSTDGSPLVVIAPAIGKHCNFEYYIPRFD